MSRSADRRAAGGAKIKGTTLGAVAAETNSSPATALLAAATAATPPAAIKTSTCGGSAAFGGGLLLCSLHSPAEGVWGQGFFQGSFPANKEQFPSGAPWRPIRSQE